MYPERRTGQYSELCHKLDHTLQEDELKVEIEKSLKRVNLWAGGVNVKRVGEFSGGMKRRLSVAISLMGSPAVVYMDEPSTVRCSQSTS